jgi:hypothetical protein
MKTKPKVKKPRKKKVSKIEKPLIASMNEALVHAKSEKADVPLVDSSFVRCIKIPEDIINGTYKPSIWFRFTQWLEDQWPFNDYMYISSVEEYINKSTREKTKWSFFYKEHMLRLDGQDWFSSFTSKESKECEKEIEKYQAKRWPIQYWLRNKFNIKWWPKYLNDFWYEQIKCRLNPKQKWLTKIIPLTWTDKTWLIPEVLFAMVIDFVEGEKCFENTEYGGDVFSTELKQCYDYAKAERKKLQKEYENVSIENGFEEYSRLEKLITDTDTHWLIWIVSNRDRLWT